ncbi:RxLR effector protein [Phytophthora megakarya]|uniref:RxLR effector protein n=1 Tax=Phytophthora megakarya TaxID=4795 RepID=A0A225UBS9_9STRA|nr:RxLR effector protein [Phytophthora megakarya]
MYTVVVTMTLLVCSVTAHLDQTTEIAKRSRQIPTLDAGENVASTARFLRDGDTDNDIADEVERNEERVSLFDKLVNIPLLRLVLKVTITRKSGAAPILLKLHRIGIPMREDFLLVWLGYAQKYRPQGVSTWVYDEYIVMTLREVIPESQLSVVFNAMEKNSKLRSFGKDLQKEALRPKLRVGGL